MAALISSFRNRRWMIAAATLFAAQLLPLAFANPQIYEAGLFCGTSRPPANAAASFLPAFVKVMEGLSQQVTAHGSGHHALNSSNISIYAMSQCYGDLSHDDCLQCYAASRTRIPRCLPAVAGRIYLDGCFMRYDNYSFFKESLDSAHDKVNCTSTVGADAAGVVNFEFRRNVGQLIRNVTAKAVVNGGYAVREGKGAFGLAECWNTVSREGCRACLAKARKEVTGCLPGREGRALNSGCYLRYSTTKFFLNQTHGPNSISGASRKGALVAISLFMVALCMLCLFASYAAYTRWKKLKKERHNLGQISYSYNKSGLNFKYETLEKATNYFDPERKVGQGGAGSVYRGTLANGKDVAVKRLFFSTRQWVDEFFNEINLISGIEHKFLVKLLGCSIEGPESLLVYEFVPNKSLEHSLFDKDKAILSWQERHNIIAGTAEGIAFLHGGLEFRIIHRDIKSGNILLDANLNPKIADFGLARLFAADKTHLSTGIAGTLGYMAPEYLVKGQLTEKADVYSFGVLVLEIVSGRKSHAFVEDSGSLLQTVWKLYKTDRLPEFVDTCLQNAYPSSEEASRVLKIGLLCVQASPSHRPSMDEVVQMLQNENFEIPIPNQPPFLNSSSISTSSTNSSYSLYSSTSNPGTKAQASNASTESFNNHTSNNPSGSHDHLQTK